MKFSRLLNYKVVFIAKLNTRGDIHSVCPSWSPVLFPITELGWKMPVSFALSIMQR